jgi:hypothetical protein
MRIVMKTGLVGVLAVVAACSGTVTNPAVGPQTFDFGPFTLQPEQELTDQCVQITLHNTTDLYVNSVHLETGPGFHHSNWFWMPEPDIQGSDGTFTCTDRGFSEAVGAIYGGVVFAQSTQSPDDTQAFAPGAAIKIPANSRLVAAIHLLNPGETPLTLRPKITLTGIAEGDVTTQLAAISFEDQALGLPPNAQSAFSLDCDLGSASQNAVGGPPSFNIYYTLAHYHALGIGMTVEAVKPDDTSTMIFQTQNTIGDALGATIDPAFDMTGYTRLRVTCNYYNSTADVVKWGVGNQEMCVFLAFTDSPFDWGGGAVTPDPPGDPTDVDGVMTYSHACTVYATPLPD